jgi:hypothetical protein
MLGIVEFCLNRYDHLVRHPCDAEYWMRIAAELSVPYCD